jgi:trk/ktr system potassium uptake protein
MDNKYAVIGLGLFGNTLAMHLAEAGYDVLAIDIDMDKVEAIKDKVAEAVQMDSTDFETLRNFGLQGFDVVVVAIGDHFENMILTTVNLQKLEVEKIISRAMNPVQKEILLKIGIEEHNIISPEIQVADLLMERMIQPEINSFIKLSDKYQIAQFTAPEKCIGKSIEELHFRRNFQINVIAIERRKDKDKESSSENIEVIPVTNPEIVIQAHDEIFALGENDDIQKFITIYE